MSISRFSLFLTVLLVASNVWAQEITPQHTIPAPPIDIAQNAPAPAQPTQTSPPSFSYSNAYEVRADIHKYASVTTLPLFAAEYALGQAIYDGNGSSGLRSAHGAVSTGIVGLFAVSSVTGVWNLIEARHDPRDRRLRTVHGILLLASNAGFVAAAATAPHHDRGVSSSFQNDRATHRNIAIASIGVGAAGYLIMLLHH